MDLVEFFVNELVGLRSIPGVFSGALYNGKTEENQPEKQVETRDVCDNSHRDSESIMHQSTVR